LDLLLRRAPAASGEVYDVLRGRTIVGRIMLSNGSAASQWVWTISYHYHEDRTPTHGYEPSRDAAMKAFFRSWHREWSGRVTSVSRALAVGRSSSSLLTPMAVLRHSSLPTADILIELVQSGLVIARNECLEDEDGAVETTRAWITEAGVRVRAAPRVGADGQEEKPRRAKG
jgi:hypothetical protein